MANYNMRAYHTVNLTHVYWLCFDAPDFVGTLSGYTPGDLSDILVYKIIPTFGGPGEAWVSYPFNRLVPEPIDFPYAATTSETVPLTVDSFVGVTLFP